jgi:hypothetical protein
MRRTIMHIDEWAILTGVFTSLAVAIGPWMFKVHAKLAVIASRMASVCDKLEAQAADQRRLWDICARHESQLCVHSADLARLSARDGEA